MKIELDQSVVLAIERKRRDQGMSVAELARRIDTDGKRLWYVLNLKREMRVSEFLRLCVVLKLDPRRFITREMMEEIERSTKRSLKRPY